MKHILGLVFVLAPFLVLAESVKVPSLGSTWEYRMVRYNRELGVSIQGGIQQVSVPRMLHGRPVFSARLGGREFELFEHEDGVAVVERDCANHVEYRAPQLVPNMCGWNPCRIQSGQTLLRKVYVFSHMTSCRQGVHGTVRYRGISEESVNVLGKQVLAVRTEASIDIPGMGSGSWNPRILKDYGEVYSTGISGNEESVYLSINVVHVPHVVSADLRVNAADVVRKESILRPEDFCPKAGSQERTWIAFGDSLTAGGDGSYPEELGKHLKGENIRMLNAGFAGDTTEKLLARVDMILACKPELVLLSVGGNDMFQGVSREVFEERLIHLVSLLRSHSIEVILLGIEVDTQIPYAGSYTRIARFLRIPYIPNMLDGVYGNAARISEDGIHPNRAGYVTIAELVYLFLSTPGPSAM